MTRTLVLLLTLMLAGCGFHLRRELALPPNLSTLRLEIANPYSTLGRGLEKALRRAGAELTDAAGSAVLRIQVKGMQQLPLAVGANGQVQEYALRYRVDIELIDAAREVFVANQSIELERTYTFDSAQALGSPAEQEIVRDELEREMVTAILSRIDAALRSLT